MNIQRPTLSFVTAAAATGLITAAAAAAGGTIEMTWDNDILLGDWNLIANWIPPFGELPSVPDQPGEAAVMLDPDPLTIQTDITLDMDPTIDYLSIENPDATLLLGGRLLTLLGVGSSQSSGRIVADTATSQISGTFSNLGYVDIDQAATLVLDGPTVWNLGVITVTGGASPAVLRFEDNVTLRGFPVPIFVEVVLDAGTQPARLEVATGFTLTNDYLHTIRGDGVIEGAVINEGEIFADGGPLTIDTLGGRFATSGLVDVDALTATGDVVQTGGTATIGDLDTGSSMLHIVWGTTSVTGLFSAGLTHVASPGSLTVDNAFTQSGGSVTVHGDMLCSGGMTLIDGAKVRGNGLVTGHVQNTSGEASPGSHSGSVHVGTLHLESYAQETTGRLYIELDGAGAGDFDVLEMTLGADIAGELRIELETGMVAAPLGQSFQILNTGSDLVGEFDVVTSEWATFSIAYGAQDATITVTSWPSCGAQDLDNNGNVGITDFLALLGLWGPCPGPPGCPGDTDGDGLVGITDFLDVLANWGAACG